MTQWQRHIPFKVDIAGVIDIMGASLYSRPDTPIREMLQNAHDAIMRRRRTDLDFRGRIDVVQNADEHTISFQDDGIGLTPEDAEDYLGTVGAGITGLIKRSGDVPDSAGGLGDRGDLIGQFGVGLFSAFMLADRIVVESRHDAADHGIRWEAGAGTEIELMELDRAAPGTVVTLYLKPEYRFLSTQPESVEKAIREYADFLPIPIYLNRQAKRVNVIHAAWFEPSQDREATELALQEYFDEAPIDVIPIRVEKPASIAGALYVTPQRVPGFTDQSAVMVTVRRMVISRKIQGLVPAWATFLRGCLELHDCSPTTSREDLVRDDLFERIKSSLEDLIFSHFSELAKSDPTRLEAVVNWHRYTFAGAALENGRLRGLLRHCYRLPTSHGSLTLDEILKRSVADSLYEEEADRVVWYNTDRRQERWVNTLFAEHEVPCVHTFRSFEESLLAQCAHDDNAKGTVTDLRIATPSAPNFATTILGVSDLEDIEPRWREFLEHVNAKILVGSFRRDQPVMAFLNERYELARSFDEMKQRGEIPRGFQRLIESHFKSDVPQENEVILNRNHPMISRALSQKPGMPLSSVMRLIVINALNSAGAATPDSARKQQTDDLDWIAQCLWGKDG
ncbi:HSP90 family protein [Planctomicrobium piriforme]|uniref:Molecular chaperone, HSP90 family n=1 Tax=Planctomicrobium piriforme TaxID=1576369 RepID=A0A1I3C3R8_9PLAN|nr:ATP-binding protein [Planctomicrobium piriforme]SFH69090.1 Molecular chaperone, HSP90 family [Planctomicrobium piriforme]